MSNEFNYGSSGGSIIDSGGSINERPKSPGSTKSNSSCGEDSVSNTPSTASKKSSLDEQLKELDMRLTSKVGWVLFESFLIIIIIINVFLGFHNKSPEVGKGAVSESFLESLKIITINDYPA